MNSSISIRNARVGRVGANAPTRTLWKCDRRRAIMAVMQCLMRSEECMTIASKHVNRHVLGLVNKVCGKIAPHALTPRNAITRKRTMLDCCARFYAQNWNELQTNLP